MCYEKKHSVDIQEKMNRKEAPKGENFELKGNRTELKGNRT